MSPYWEHTDPLRCPKRHKMGWLGLVFWLCSKCRVIYVEEPPYTLRRARLAKIQKGKQND